MSRRTKLRWSFALAPVFVLSACKGILGLGDPELATEKADGGEKIPDNEGGTPSDVDASCDADLSSDPKNCGRCGHDCGRGKCSARQCQPFVLTTLPSHAEEIAEDATYVYVVPWDSATVVRVNKASGEKTTLKLPADVAAIAVGGEVLYWSTHWSEDAGGASVRECGLPNCGGSVATRLSAVGSELYGTVQSLVAVNGFGGDKPVVWLDLGRGQVAVPGPTFSSFPKELAAAKTGERGVIHFMKDSATLYWSETGGKLIGSLKQGETVPRTFDIAPYDVDDFVVVGNTILFVRDKSGAKGVLSRGTLGATTVDGIADVGDIGDPQQVLLDGDSLLVLADDALRSCPAKECGSLVVLASASAKGGFSGLAVDKTTIWFGAADGTVYGLAK